MTHIKYPKIYRLGHEDTDFILEGECVIQEKIDGANASIWVEKVGAVYEIHVGSRTRDLGADSFNGLQDYIKSHEGIVKYLMDNPTHRLFGEWLVRHTISYDETSYKKFYLFDIFYDFELKEEDWEFKRIESLDVEQIAAKYGILYPKIFAVITNPTEKYINEFIGDTTLGPKGEGVVIKNFGYTNKWGCQTYAKVVSEKFKEDNAVVFGGNNKHSDTYNEMWVVNKFMTVARVQKTMDKLQPIIDKRLDMEHTGRVINTAYHDLITEEIWTIQKKFNSIHFKNLARVAQKKAAQIYHDILNNNISVADIVEKKIEKVSGNNSAHRLTVATDRITIKFKKGSSQEEKDDIEKWFMDVAEQMKNVKKTFRGSYNEETKIFSMRDDKRNETITFTK